MYVHTHNILQVLAYEILLKYKLVLACKKCDHQLNLTFSKVFFVPVQLSITYTSPNTINVEIFVATIFCGLNFQWDRFLWERASIVHRNYCKLLILYVFNFVGVLSQENYIVTNENFCVYGFDKEILSMHYSTQLS